MKTGYFKTYPFARAGFFAFPLLVFMVIMESYIPTVAPDGYKSFMIAFEFARTPEEIHTLLKGLSAAVLKNINIGIYIDYGFMFTYVLFLLFFLRETSKTFLYRWLLVGIPICLIILGADFYENTLLIQITESYSPTISDIELNSILEKLHTTTWIKWGSLSIVFALIAIAFFDRKQHTLVEGLVCVVPLLIGFFAFSNNPTIISWFTISIFMVFFMLLLFSFTYNIEKAFQN